MKDNVHKQVKARPFVNVNQISKRKEKITLERSIMIYDESLKRDIGAWPGFISS